MKTYSTCINLINYSKINICKLACQKRCIVHLHSIFRFRQHQLMLVPNEQLAVVAISWSDAEFVGRCEVRKNSCVAKERQRALAEEALLGRQKLRLSIHEKLEAGTALRFMRIAQLLVMRFDTTVADRVSHRQHNAVRQATLAAATARISFETVRCGLPAILAVLNDCARHIVAIERDRSRINCAISSATQLRKNCIELQRLRQSRRLERC